MSWSQAALDLLFRLHIQEGLSAAETARAIGAGVTRNAVLGKVQRMGWSRPRDEPRAAGLAIGEARRGGRSSKGPRLGPNLPLPALRQVAAHGTPRLWTERRAGECAFPIGEPARPGLQLSCCAPARGGAYCPAHRALMSVPDSQLTDRDVAAIAEIARRAA